MKRSDEIHDPENDLEDNIDKESSDSCADHVASEYHRKAFYLEINIVNHGYWLNKYTFCFVLFLKKTQKYNLETNSV